jgi:4-hydroxybenzoate polyprenyltransferase
VNEVQKLQRRMRRYFIVSCVYLVAAVVMYSQMIDEWDWGWGFLSAAALYGSIMLFNNYKDLQSEARIEIIMSLRKGK